MRNEQIILAAFVMSFSALTMAAGTIVPVEPVRPLPAKPAEPRLPGRGGPAIDVLVPGHDNKGGKTNFLDPTGKAGARAVEENAARKIDSSAQKAEAKAFYDKAVNEKTDFEFLSPENGNFPENDYAALADFWATMAEKPQLLKTLKNKMLGDQAETVLADIKRSIAEGYGKYAAERLADPKTVNPKNAEMFDDAFKALQEPVTNDALIKAITRNNSALSQADAKQIVDAVSKDYPSASDKILLAQAVYEYSHGLGEGDVNIPQLINTLKTTTRDALKARIGIREIARRDPRHVLVDRPGATAAQVREFYLLERIRNSTVAKTVYESENAGKKWESLSGPEKAKFEENVAKRLNDECEGQMRGHLLH